MPEVQKLFLDLGIGGALIVIILYLGFKYVPKLIDHSLEKAKKKDYREELYLEAIRNNTEVIKNNTAVIEANTNNNEKLFQLMSEFRADFESHDRRAEKTFSDIAVIKERTK